MKRLVLDVGGSAIKYAVMDDELRILEKGKLEGRRSDAGKFAEAILSLRKQYPEAEGIAISYCGEVDPGTGQIMSPGSYDFFENMNLKTFLEEKSGTTVWVENDAICAALAEKRNGVLQKEKNAAVLIYGTGIGCALILDGRIYYGATYQAGVATLVSTSRKAFIPKFRLDDFLRFFNGKILRKKDPKGIDGFRFFRQVERKNPLALYRLKRFTRQAARFIVDLQLMLNLEAIAIGGGVSAQPRFIQEIQQALDQEWESYWVRITRVPKPEIKVASAGNDANLIGALIHFQDMERGH